MSAELLRDLARAKALFQLRAVCAVIGAPPASVDTRPKDGDCLQAPLASGAVGAEGDETPNP